METGSSTAPTTTWCPATAFSSSQLASAECDPGFEATTGSQPYIVDAILALLQAAGRSSPTTAKRCIDHHRDDGYRYQRPVGLSKGGRKHDQSPQLQRLVDRPDARPAHRHLGQSPGFRHRVAKGKRLGLVGTRVSERRGMSAGHTRRHRWRSLCRLDRWRAGRRSINLSRRFPAWCSTSSGRCSPGHR